jgi:two-component system nitrate/nitrite response regulator NarL
MQISLLVGCVDEDLGQSVLDAIEQQDAAGIKCSTVDLDFVLATAAAMQPDVLLLERVRDSRAAFGVLDAVNTVSPGTRTLLLCDSCNQQLTIDCIKLGACGCLPRSSESALLVKAVRAAFRGETWYGRAALLQALRSQVCSIPALRVDDAPLTRREDEILHLIGSGLSNKEIGRRLEISDKTVKTHLHHIYVKLNRSGRYKAFLSKPAAPAMFEIRTLDQ